MLLLKRLEVTRLPAQNNFFLIQKRFIGLSGVELVVLYLQQIFKFICYIHLHIRTMQIFRSPNKYVNIYGSINYDISNLFLRFNRTRNEDNYTFNSWLSFPSIRMDFRRTGLLRQHRISRRLFLILKFLRNAQRTQASVFVYVFLSHLQFINNINLAKDQPILCSYRSIDQFIRPVRYPILQKLIERKFTILNNYSFIYIRFIRKMS